jgi:ferredoxin-NADP reductase
MSEIRINSIDEVGPQTVALRLETPEEFTAFPGQFVLVKATIGSTEETSYYTLSSSDVEETFEITVAVDPSGTLGPWLANRSEGQTITVEGPYGNVQYAGDGDVVALSSGPGIGPAVGIGERAVDTGHNATLLCCGDQIPHRERLDRLSEAGVTVVIVDNLEDITKHPDYISDEQIYVFGFNEFVTKAKELLTASGVSIDQTNIESFGSE